MATQEYLVSLRRQENGETTVASVRDFELRLASKSGDPSVGINPAETLLSAVGACITSSLGLVARNSRARLDRLDVVVKGIRQDRPPLLLSIRYRIFLDTPESDEKIERILMIAERNSTVISTLKQAVDIQGEWRRISGADPIDQDF